LLVTLVARCLVSVGVSLLVWTCAPAVLGWHSTLVLSGSMSPSVLPGDVAVVRPVEPSDLRVGHVLLVDDPDRPGELRLHRLAGVTDGRLVLRGDANQHADSTPVDPAQVRGALVLRVPAVGRPAIWAAEGRHGTVGAGAVVALLVLWAACWHRPEEGAARTGVEQILGRLGLGSVPRPEGRRVAGRGAAAGLVVVAAMIPVLGGVGVASSAPYAGTAFSPGSSLGGATYYTCANAAYDGSTASPGPNRALRYYGLQEASGTAAVNGGTAGTTANGTYVGTPVLTASGPTLCRTGGQRAVTLNGSSQWVNTTATTAAPTTMSVEIWFRTTTTSGGRLLGFGNATGTTSLNRASTRDDRHLYLTNTGRVAFGVLAGTSKNAVTSTAAYNDGTWHHAVGTLSGTGMTLYVDGVQTGFSAATTSSTAAAYTGAWRVGYDVLTGWQDPPTSPFFAGTVAHAAVYSTALTTAQVAAHHAAGS
jgi:signal peptidase I